MIKASAKLKFIFFIDAILFLICLAGLISIDQKAKLPFELTTQDSLLSIQIPDSNPYGLSTGDKLISVNGLNVGLLEKTEFITDKKNIGDKIKISVLTKSGTKNLTVVLIEYYSAFYLLSTAIVALLFFIIAVFVLLKKSELRAAHVFHWASICISIMMCLTWSNLNTFSIISMYLFRIMLFTVYVATPALFVHFTLVFPRDNSYKWRNLLRINYSIAFVLAILTIYLFFTALSKFNDSLIDDFLGTFNILRIYLIVNVVMSISIFIFALIIEKGKVERQQLKWLLFGFIIGPLSFVILWLIPILFAGKALVPEEIIMILLCAIPITFAIAIIKYHLLDIDEVLNRSIVYGIVISILLILYSVAIGIFVSSFHSSDQSILSAAAAVLLALLFQPIKTKVQKFVDIKFFRIQYNFRKELNRFTLQIKNYNDINSLGDYLIREIDNLIPVEKIAFSELDSKTGKLLISAHKNFDQIANKSLRIKPETLERKWFQVAAVKNKVESEVNISTLFQNTLLRWKINLVVPIKSVKDELYGFVILGNKKSGSRFSTEDVDLLKDIGINAGSTIERIKLQEELILEHLEAERLDELNKMISFFVSSVSHELKTPLTSIKMFAELLKDKAEFKSAKSREYLEIIEGESDRLKRLIDNVLDYAKIEKGLQTYDMSLTDINQLAIEVLKMMEYQFKMAKIEFVENISKEKYIINADKGAVEEAMINILSNAIKYSDQNTKIIVSTNIENGFINYKVEDEGVGISQKDLNEIFNPFFRSQSDGNVKAEGAGLGLAIVKHIIDAHKGKIIIESTIGKGSSFILQFPNESNNKT